MRESGEVSADNEERVIMLETAARQQVAVDRRKEAGAAPPSASFRVRVHVRPVRVVRVAHRHEHNTLDRGAA